MQVTIWKPTEEIQYSLRTATKVSILSCGMCANLCDTGGKAGIRTLRKLVKQWGKEVVFARCMVACCPQDMMAQTIRIFRRRIAKSDVLVILSCAAGMKSAQLSDPGVPVITALDTLGGMPLISQGDDLAATTLCVSCDHCVLSYTGGICPVGACPEKAKYGPCKEQAKADGTCPLNPSLACVWLEIARRGDLAALKELGRLHSSAHQERLASDGKRRSSSFLRGALRMVARIGARVRGFETLVRSYK